MGAPVPTRYQNMFGVRKGEATFHVVWTQQDSDNLDNAIFIAQDEFPGNYDSERVAIEKVHAESSMIVASDIEFNSFPPSPAGHICSVPPDSTDFEEDFTLSAQGTKSDPNRESPGDVVVSTRNALPGEELFIRVHFRIKGKALPSGVLSA